MTVGHREDVPDTSVAGMRANAFSTFDEAWRLGVRHFDAARSYGEGEAFLAAWMSERGHAGAFVSSKWGYRYTAKWQRTAPVHEVKDHSLANLARQWRESSALLGSRLRLYQIHSLTPDSPALEDARLLDDLERLRDSGVAIGASASGPRQAEIIDRLVSVERAGRRLFDWVQATWNVLERSAGPALRRARNAGMRIIVKEALANGRLGPRGDVAPVLAEARRMGATADALSLAVALAQPFADVVLSGAATPAQIRSNMAARQIVVSPDALAGVGIPADLYWSQRSQLKWT